MPRRPRKVAAASAASQGKEEAILITIGFHAINVTTISSLCLNLCNVYASPAAIFHERQASVIANAGGCHIHREHRTKELGRVRNLKFLFLLLMSSEISLRTHRAASASEARRESITHVSHSKPRNKEERNEHKGCR